MSETKIQAAIVKALKVARVWVIRTQSKGRTGKRSIGTGEPGMPDLYLPGLGHLEVKAPGGKLSVEQVAWHARAARAGVRVATVTTTLEALQQVSLWQIQAARQIQAAHPVRLRPLRIVK